MKALRVLLATLTLFAGLLFPALTPPRAAAVEPEALVSIRLDSFQPSLPQRDSVITVTGAVTNTSEKRLLRPRAYFWRNQAPITDAEGFDQALASASNDPIGARKIASFDNLFEDGRPYLEAGATARFALKVKVADLELSPTSGLYLMGVHVLQNEMTPAVGRARVFVPVVSKDPRNVVQTTTVVTLDSRPSLVSRGLFADDHLAQELAPGGRLSVLLRAADRPDTTFAVDPALVEEIQTMKGGYQVMEGGSPADGSGKADAERWLTAFARLSATRDGYRLLYGSPDVAALAHAGQPGVLQSSLAAGRAVADVASLPLLAWPASGLADAETLDAATRLKPAAILLSDSSTRSEIPLLQGLNVPGVDPAPVVSYTTAASAGGPGPDPSETPVHLQQRLLAESWLQASTRPTGTTIGHVHVVSTAAQAGSDEGAVRAPWVKQTSLSELLRSTPAEWDGVLHYSDTDRERELEDGQLDAVTRLSTSWATWQDLLVDPSSARAAANAAVARAASVRLRGSDGTFRSFVAPQQRELAERLNAVKISANRQVLTPQSRVSFPVTIRNTLKPVDQADSVANQVRVQLRFSSANAQRLTVQPIELTTIEAGESVQATAVVDARTNGTVRVTAQLFTDSGRPVGRPALIDVKATQAGTVGWFIAIGAGIVLVGTTALRIRQVARTRARAAALAPREPLDATRSAPAQDVSTGDPTTPGGTTPTSETGSPGQNSSESIDV